MAKNQSLEAAVFEGNELLTAKLAAKYPDQIHRQDEMGFTPLHWAADRGYAKIIQILMDAGASPDQQDMDGLTPLHFASLKGEWDCARLMIPFADIEIVDSKRGLTARELAQSSAVDPDDVYAAGAQKIADALNSEPARRAAVAQANELSTSMAHASPSSKPRI